MSTVPGFHTVCARLALGLLLAVTGLMLASPDASAQQPRPAYQQPPRMAQRPGRISGSNWTNVLKEQPTVRPSRTAGRVPAEVIEEDPPYYDEELSPVPQGAVADGCCTDGCCAGTSFDCGDPCGRSLRVPCDTVWVRGEYLLWWTKGFNTPPLVTTSPDGTAQAAAGVIGRPGTQVVFGDSELNGDDQSGYRVWLGTWLDDCQCIGLEGNYLHLTEQTEGGVFGSDGSTIFSRSFFNIQTGLQDAELVAFPNVLSGGVAVHSASELQSAEFLLRRSMVRDCNYRVDFLIGYRFARLDDTLRITEDLEATGIGSGVAIGTTIDLYDNFQTKNDFHGAQLGMETRYQWCRWTLGWRMKLGLGNTRSRVLIDGRTTTQVPGSAAVTSLGGLLAQQSNIGQFEQNNFSVVPELGVSLSYDLTRCLKATVGYSFLYWSHVGRPGDQVDPELNLSQLPPGPLVGEGRPTVQFVPTDYWAQGINIGLDYQF